MLFEVLVGDRKGAVEADRGPRQPTLLGLLATEGQEVGEVAVEGAV